MLDLLASGYVSAIHRTLLDSWAVLTYCVCRLLLHRHWPSKRGQVSSALAILFLCYVAGFVLVLPSSSMVEVLLPVL